MFIAERRIDGVVDVVRVNERIMYVKLVIENQIENNKNSLLIFGVNMAGRTASGLL